MHIKLSAGRVSCFAFVSLLLLVSLSSLGQTRKVLEEAVFDDGVAWLYGHKEGPPIHLVLEEQRVLINGWPVYPPIFIPDTTVQFSEEELRAYARIDTVDKFIGDIHQQYMHEGVPFNESMNRIISLYNESGYVDSVQVLGISDSDAFLKVFWSDRSLTKNYTKHLYRNRPRREIAPKSEEQVQEETKEVYTAYISGFQSGSVPFVTTYGKGSASRRNAAIFDSLARLSQEELEQAISDNSYPGMGVFIRSLLNPLPLSYKKGGGQ